MKKKSVNICINEYKIRAYCLVFFKKIYINNKNEKKKKRERKQTYKWI